MTQPTPRSLPRGEPPYLIAESHPAFPCWLWNEKDNNWRDCRDAWPRAMTHQLIEAGYTHWWPNQPIRPTVRPTPPPPSDMGATPTPRTDAFYNTGECGDIFACIKFTQLLEWELNQAKRELHALAGTDAAYWKAQRDAHFELSQTLRQQLTAMTAERDEANFQWQRNIEEHGKVYDLLTARLTSLQSERDRLLLELGEAKKDGSPSRLGHDHPQLHPPPRRPEEPGAALKD